MEKRKCTEEEKGYWGTEIAIMQPTVVNVSLENVSLEEIDTEQGVVLTKMDDVNLDYQNESGK
jgi:hypothetical protein